MKHLYIILSILFLTLKQLNAQNCVFKDPVVNIDFGKGEPVTGLNANDITTYIQVGHACPNDGFYSFVSRTGDCFMGDWFTLREDHTPGDKDGNMMLINASYDGGLFFSTTIPALKKNTVYEFGVWMMNVCKINNGCPPLLPDILILIKTTNGKKLAEFRTGLINQYDEPRWRRYVGMFQTGSSEKNLVITMQDMNPGGCGNDFAMDDITLRECIKPPVVISQKSSPVEKEEKKSPSKVTVQPKPKPKPVASVPVTKQVLKQENPDIPVLKESVLLKNPIPEVLQTRTNSLVRVIESEAGEISIRLYDNGQIDGDTVSIYHNNQLIVSKAGLSQKPVTVSLSIDKNQPHHELVMVAENLGSIPPNTSLMIISTPSKRYEVFISSTEQKNAKVVIELK